MKAFLAALVLGFAFGAPAWADPSGSFSVSGTNPGGNGTYEGTVTINKTGETYKVVWTIGGSTVTGTAVGDDEFLSIGYASGAKPGVGLYVKKNGTWTGIWSYLGQTSLGQETWTP